jgi:Sulfotransferase family
MQLIFIGGAQRSGTTLLQTLLANALRTPVLPEAHILADVLTAFKRAKQFPNKTQFFFSTSEDLLCFFRSCAGGCIANVLSRTGALSALVFKDPHFVEVLDEASALFADSIRVVCIRDPLDIAASFVQIGQRQPVGSKPTKYQRRDMDFIGKKILSFCAPLMTSKEAPILVRYEDLASNPREALRELGRDTGLKLLLDRIETPVWLERTARHHESSWVTELEGRKPYPSSIGSFKRVLRPDEIATVQNICGPIMMRFGYAADGPSLSDRGRSKASPEPHIHHAPRQACRASR